MATEFKIETVVEALISEYYLKQGEHDQKINGVIQKRKAEGWVVCPPVQSQHFLLDRGENSYYKVVTQITYMRESSKSHGFANFLLRVFNRIGMFLG